MPHPVAAQEAFVPTPISTCYYALDPRAVGPGLEPNPAVVKLMVDSLVLATTGAPDIVSAWKSLVEPEDVVGIKVAAAPGTLGGTHPVVVEAVAAGLRQAGIPANRILVWDRDRSELIAAGYRTDSPNYQLRWIDPATGYDRDAIITAPVLGRLIWGDSKFGQKDANARLEDLLASGDQLSSTSHFAKVLSSEVTKVINIPSMCDSFFTGINGALANMTIPNIDNWRRFTRPPQYGDPWVAEIYADPQIFNKVVLTIMDGLRIQYAGGPNPNPNFVEAYFTIYASKDPVAIDATALSHINEYRLVNHLPEIKEISGHVQSAQDLGIGVAAIERIQTRRVNLVGGNRG